MKQQSQSTGVSVRRLAIPRSVLMSADFLKCLEDVFSDFQIGPMQSLDERVGGKAGVMIL